MKYYLCCLCFTFSFFVVHTVLAQQTVTRDSVSYQINRETGEAIILGPKQGTNLKRVVFPPKIRVGENDYTVVELKAFRSPTLEEVTIPETVKKIYPKVFYSSEKLKVITLPSNSPVEWFKNDVFLAAKFDELRFSATPENFVQRGRVLYSNNRKTIYDVRFLHDTIFFVPDEVDSVYFNWKESPSPMHIVLHKDVKFVNDAIKGNHYPRRQYLAIPIDVNTIVFDNYLNGKMLAEYISANLENQCVTKLDKKDRERLNIALYKDRTPFRLNIEKDDGVEKVVLDYIYSTQPNSKNRHVEILENKQENLTPLYVPIRVLATPKSGKRILGYIYFNDTIVGTNCTVYSCFTKQRLVVLSAKENEFVEGFDYKLSSDKATLQQLSISTPLFDFRTVPGLGQIKKIASFSLNVSQDSREIFLPNQLDTIDASYFSAPAKLELLAYPTSIKTLRYNAYKDLLSVERIYIQGESSIRRNELEKVYLSTSTTLQQLLVDAEAIPFWKEKLANSPLLPLLKGVEQNVKIINTEPDNIVTIVRRLDTREEFQLDAKNSTVSLPRATPISISIQPNLSYDIRRLVLNKKVLESTMTETFLLDTLRISSQGETVSFRVNILPCIGGNFVVKKLDETQLGSNSEQLRGTKLRIVVTSTSPFHFKYWSFNGQNSQALDTVIEVRQHLLLSASFYRHKPILDMRNVDRRCNLSLLDAQSRPRFFEDLYEGDTVFLQAPILPQGEELNTFEVNGALVENFPHKLIISESLTIKATLIPKLCTISLSEVAAKYLDILDENGTPLVITSPLPYGTKFIISFHGKKSERLVKLLLNSEAYRTNKFPMELLLHESLSIDVEITTLFNTLHIELPPSCSLIINGNEIKNSTDYRAEHGTRLMIRAISGEAYTVSGIMLDGNLFAQENELTVELVRNSHLKVLAIPNLVELTYASTGNGQLIIRTKDEQLTSHAMLYSGDEIFLELIAEPENECTKLTINGEDIPPLDTKLLVVGPMHIKATFKPYTIDNLNGIYVNRRTNSVVGCVPELVKMTLDYDQIFNIANNAFLDNKNLQTVDINQGITSIGVASFASTKIKKVHLGSCVSKVGRNAFAECNDLCLMDLEHTNPSSLEIEVSALKPRKKDGFLLRVPNTSVESFLNNSTFSRFKIVPAMVSYILEGDFIDINNVRVEKREYWESEDESYNLAMGVHELAGGTRITFKNDDAIEEKITALYVDNKRVKLPYTHVLLKPVIFRVQMKKTNDGTAVDDPILSPTLEITPNPVHDLIHIKTRIITPATYYILNSQGTIVRVGTLQESSQTIFIDELPSGVYFLRLNLTNGSTVKRFVKD